MRINQESWTLRCQNAAERNALLKQAADYEVPVLNDKLSNLPEALSIGWCEHVGALVAYEQTGQDNLPDPGVRRFQSMCAQYAASHVLA